MKGTGEVMPGNRIGGLRATKTIVARYGVNEDGKSVLHVNAGRLGGLKSRGGGFAADPELASRAGKSGGLGTGHCSSLVLLRWLVKSPSPRSE